MSQSAPANRFEIIDLYRGFGAICIFISHGQSFVGTLLLPQAYLALDVFFVMSGFVIASGFDGAIARGMSLKRFFWLRMIRFYPAYIAALICTVPLVMMHMSRQMPTLPWTEVAASSLLGLFMLPSPLDPSNLGRLYPLNGVCWSLLFEMVVNLAYFLLFARLSKRFLEVFLLLLAVLLVASRLHVGTLNVGYEWSTALFALPKLSFAFFMGVYLRRHVYPHLTHTPGPLTALVSLVTMILFFQHSRFAGGQDLAWVDFAAVFLAFPLIVLLSSGITPFAWLATAGRWSGWFSYPMYVFQNFSFLLFAGAFQVLAGYSATAYKPWIILPILAMATIMALAVNRWVEPWGFGVMKKRLLPAKLG